jgi:hypothetical protein
MSDKQLTITIPLDEFVRSHLGITPNSKDGVTDQMWHHRDIPLWLADLIVAKTNNISSCYIQYPDKYDPHLKTPRLWDLSAWHTYSDSWERQARRSEQERKERFLLDANSHLLARAWLKSDWCGVSETMAIAICRKWLVEGKLGVVKMLGVTLYKTIEEI